MNLVYNEDQQQLLDSARDFLAAKSPVSVQRRLRDEASSSGFCPQVWQGMRDLGWSAVAFEEKVGGLEFGFAGYAPIFEQMGRHLAASPLLSSIVLCGGLVELMGSEEQQQQLLPALIAGELRAALALEESERHQPDLIKTRARMEQGGWLLDGRKEWVADGNEADAWLVVAAVDANELGVFLVHAGAKGLSLEPRTMIDARNMAAMTLQGAKAERIGGCAAEALDLVLDRGRACLAAELLGVSEALFDMTVEYLKTRVQFGVPIGSFQALQHRAARLYVELQLARSSTMAAFSALENQAIEVNERRRLVSLAKWKANICAQRISNEAVQMHGGIGVTDEYDLGLFLKRTRLAQNQLGHTDFHCARYACNLSTKNA
ncbi:MAG: acyl-CoA dehydrogenase family protein [Gammaproteobacteria bacterium]|nr:acyl-CoA dehydrogenase family protein [Gammaproteobacteria bacterium]